MAPLPDNNTSCIWFTYRTGNLVTSQNHEIMLRFNPANSDIIAVQGVLYDFLVAVGAATFRQGWAIQSARGRAEGSDVSLPLALTANLVNFIGTGNAAYPLRRETEEYIYGARSALTGRRWRMSLFGVLLAAPDTLRYTYAGAPTWVQNSIDALSGAFANQDICTIDGGGATVRPYVNWQQNSFWETVLRV